MARPTIDIDDLVMEMIASISPTTEFEPRLSSTTEGVYSWVGFLREWATMIRAAGRTALVNRAITRVISVGSFSFAEWDLMRVSIITATGEGVISLNATVNKSA